MKVNFFYRANREAANSIEMLFQNLDSYMLSHRVYTLPQIGASPWVMLANCWYAFRHRADVNFITGEVYYIALALGRNTIVTYHDVGSAMHGSFMNQWFSKWLFFSLPLHICRRVVAISEQTRQELIKIVPSADKKIIVIDNPVSTQLSYKEHRFNSSKPCILHIGTKPNKNLERVIEALKDITCRLVIVGKLTDDQQSCLEASGIEYTVLCNLAYEQIVELYEECDIVSFPSLYEGFGMPLIEGNAVGRPVVAGDIPILRHVGADSACYVNPHSVSSIRNGFKRLIYDVAYREMLCAKGLNNVKRFSTPAIAEKYNKVIAELLNR